MPAANFGSFKNLFTTDDNFTSAIFFDGIISATQLINPVKLSAQDADFDAAGQERPHPFAGLAALKTGKPH